jgi:hypothetical protein
VHAVGFGGGAAAASPFIVTSMAIAEMPTARIASTRIILDVFVMLRIIFVHFL